MSTPPRVASVRVIGPRRVTVAFVGVQGPPGTGGGGAVLSVNNRTGAVVLDKSDVGLSAVDNTADADKPVSTAQAAALAGKADASHTHAVADVTGLSGALAGKADASHTHAIADVSGLGAALAGKLDATHEGAGGSVHAVATGSTAGFMAAADKTKLDGIAAGATANATDAALRDRATHTGTQTASTISDFDASARAQIEAALIAGANITITPAGSGASRTFTISASGGGAANPAVNAAALELAYACFGGL